MALSADAQALFDHARKSLPRILFNGKTAVFEWLSAITETLDIVRLQVKDWYEQSYILNATGRYLDQHAKDRGTSRRNGETDVALRQRLREVEDAVTAPAVEAGVNRILDAAGIVANCGIVQLRRDRGHFHTPGQSKAFMSRGYRMTRPTTPSSYIVILPYGTTAATQAAIEEYLRQSGPSGYLYTVERRLNP